MQLQVGCCLVFQLPWHGDLTLPNLVHWEHCCKGLGFSLLLFLLSDFLFVSSFFAISSVQAVCFFRAPWVIFSWPGSPLSLEEISWTLISGNILRSLLPDDNFLLFSVLSFKPSAAFSHYHQMIIISISIWKSQKLNSPYVVGLLRTK